MSGCCILLISKSISEILKIICAHSAYYINNTDLYKYVAHYKSVFSFIYYTGQ
jgi:hypothetical protein